jgi:ABC-type polysaccharide/polyol phosphate export permease
MDVIGRIPAAAELVRYRHLWWSLTWRDLRVRYKQSLLGIAWAVLIPLTTTLVFTFVFGRAVGVLDRMDIQMPYVLFAYIGLVPWTFFSASLNGCVNSLVANRNLVTKVYFPREVFPLAAIGSSFIDFCIAGTVLTGLLLYFHVADPAWSYHVPATLVWLPVVVCVQLAFTAGLGMLLAMANLFFRDVRQIFAVAINLWMFLTCVVYPLPTDGSRLAWIVAVNPMTPIIEAYRDCIIHGQAPFTARFAFAALTSIVAFGIGWWWFRRKSFRFAECI